jgi:hypothetical protein
MENTLDNIHARQLANIESFTQELLHGVPDIPQAAIVWTTVFDGIELPLQAIRSCYYIEGVTEDDVYAALFLPREPGVGPSDWEYVPESNAILTKNRLLAAGLSYRGRKVRFTNFVVGLVYTEVMEALEERSAKTLKLFLEMLKQEAYFYFDRCTMDDAIEAMSRSAEKGAVGYRNEYLSCKSFRVALELVNITGRTPIMVPKSRALAIA